MNGSRLPKDHGAPVRLIIPNWYGCTEVKWVNEIKFVDNDQKATWQMLEFSNRTHQDLAAGAEGLQTPVRPRIRSRLQAGHDGSDGPSGAQSSSGNLPEKSSIASSASRGAVPFAPRNSGSALRPVAMRQAGPVEFCKASTSNSQYGIWVHTFTPPRKGYYQIQVRVDDRKVLSRRLGRGEYDRHVVIPEV